MSGPLAGIRVVDMTRVVAGPVAAQTLADLGADVVKVERTGDGEELRSLGPPWLLDGNGAPTGESTYFQSVNRGKRSIQVDIARPAGADIIRRLAGRADILLENFRAGTLDRSGLGYADLSASNRRLIYCSVTGFGQTGPYCDQSGYDLLVQAMAGMMDATGHPEGAPGAGPMRVGMPLADYASGQNAAIGVLAALHHRTLTGRGQRVDIALFDSQFAMLLNQTAAWLNGGQVMPRTGNDHPTAVPSGLFTALDGLVLIATFNDREFARLAEALDHPEWVSDPRFTRSHNRVAHRTAINALVNRAIASNTRAEVMGRLHAGRISAGPVNSVRDLEGNEQLAARGMILNLRRDDGRMVRLAGSPLNLSDSPVDPRRAPPLAGEHTDEVLRDWLGMDGDAIAAARQGGVL